MALILLQLVVLGVVAAAAEDVPITWWRSSRATLPCVVPDPAAGVPRRPPPPLEDDRPRQARLYQWWRGDVEISSSKRVLSNGTLEVSRKRDGSSEGVYQCGVRQLGGVVLGLPIHLKFAYIEKTFTQHPENATGRIGQPLALSCVIDSAPVATLSWLKDGAELPENSRFHVLKTQLLITDVRPEDSGVYICIATNPFAQSRMSQPGSIQVTVSSDLEPSFLNVTQDESVMVERGNRLVLACPVLGWPRPKLIWEHTPPGGRRSELESTEEVLEMPKIELDQEGLYTCAVEGNSALVKSFTVVVAIPANITEAASTDGAVTRSVLRASTVRLNCSAVGRPTPTVTWYKDGKKIVLGGRINVLNSADGKRLQLVISEVTSDNAGVYQCFAAGGGATRTSYAHVSVAGSGALRPRAPACWPAGAARVLLRWPPAAPRVLAYTVHLQAKSDKALTGMPKINTEELINLERPLTPYTFQVRAYVPISTSKNKTVATDMSESVVCMGQGVPIKLVQMYGDTILVSWHEFAEDNPGIEQWILQYRNDSQEHNVTFDGHVHNYTLNAPKSSPLQIRVLGSRTLDWLPQNLSMVPWRSTAGLDLDDREVVPVPYDVVVSSLGARSLAVSWSHDVASGYLYRVCVRPVDGLQRCEQSTRKSLYVEDLEPDTEYEVVVLARPPAAAAGAGEVRSAPVHVTTVNEDSLGPASITGLTYKYESTPENRPALRVCWAGGRARYTAHYSAELRLPVARWPRVHAASPASTYTNQRCVQIPDVSPSSQTFVMISSAAPLAHSQILTVPPQQADEEVNDLQYEYTDSGVRVFWSVKPASEAEGGAGSGAESGAGVERVVRYAQNITRPLEQWPAITATGGSVLLTGLEPSLATYVAVSGGAARALVLTVPPAPARAAPPAYLAIGIALGICTLVALAVIAVCLWRRRKRANSPIRRRRTLSGNNSNEEDGSEMKSVGGRLANGGGSKDAGEPLLNGHVHITDNPASKTPNGKIKLGRLYDAFDVSRNDQNTTVETVLDADTSTSTTYNLLDTSRKPEFDVSRSSRELSSNNSFNKLPDDNMNSEITRSTDFDMDNSKVIPMLQPNG